MKMVLSNNFTKQYFPLISFVKWGPSLSIRACARVLQVCDTIYNVDVSNESVAQVTYVSAVFFGVAPPSA